LQEFRSPIAGSFGPYFPLGGHLPDLGVPPIRFPSSPRPGPELLPVGGRSSAFAPMCRKALAELMIHEAGQRLLYGPRSLLTPKIRYSARRARRMRGGNRRPTG
jgi:hypothetical protein